MSNKEAIKQLKDLKSHCQEFLHDGDSGEWKKDIEALNMAISTMTDFGRILQRERINRKELLGDMAAKLRMSTAHLSKVEHGKEEFTATEKERLRKLYKII